MFSRTAALAGSLSLLVAVSGCAAADGADDAGADGRLEVVTSFYPLQYAVEQVGGEHVEVTNLTKPGAEPHDLELTPKQVLATTRADQLVLLGGFQPAVDDAAAEVGGAAFDVGPAARLAPEHGDEGENVHEEHEGHAGHEDDESVEQEGHEGHDHGGADPHFWLDPTRYADVGEAIAERLAEADPRHATDYRANARELTDRLTALDEELRTGLADCRQQQLVTGHASFGYFADRYGFTQEAISGLDPGAGASPRQMARMIHHIEDEGIDTVYTEPLLPRALAETIAGDAGATVRVLDPIEGVTDASRGDDYFEIMRSNLASVREGQQCG